MSRYFLSIPHPTYQPAMRNILSITNTNPIVVTTTFDGINPGDNQYKDGLIIRLYIPKYYGMPEANRLAAPITVISPSSFSMPIDGSFFEPFAIPSEQPGNIGNNAQAVPVGEKAGVKTLPIHNVLPYP